MRMPVHTQVASNRFLKNLLLSLLCLQDGEVEEFMRMPVHRVAEIVATTNEVGGWGGCCAVRCGAVRGAVRCGVLWCPATNQLCDSVVACRSTRRTAP